MQESGISIDSAIPLAAATNALLLVVIGTLVSQTLSKGFGLAHASWMRAIVFSFAHAALLAASVNQLLNFESRQPSLLATAGYLLAIPVVGWIVFPLLVAPTIALFVYRQQLEEIFWFGAAASLITTWMWVVPFWIL